MKTRSFETTISRYLTVISHPFRIKLLLAIGKSEACVCHLEASLKKRQAFISQHLMALRKDGILETRREGKYIYYRLADAEILELIWQASNLAGVKAAPPPPDDLPVLANQCPCPQCQKEEQFP